MDFTADTEPAVSWVARTRHAWIAFHDLRVPRTTTSTVLARSASMPSVVTTWTLPCAPADDRSP
jgi:hypothetical protein